MAADAAWARKYRKHGFNMIATGTDQSILMAGIRGVLQSSERGDEVRFARSNKKQRGMTLSDSVTRGSLTPCPIVQV